MTTMDSPLPTTAAEAADSQPATDGPMGLAAVLCSPLLDRVLDNGEMQWKMWAENWRTSPAYGNGQPEIHPKHAKVIAEFGEARQEIADMTAALNGIHTALDECLMVPANVLPAWNAVIDILRRWHEPNK